MKKNEIAIYFVLSSMLILEYLLFRNYVLRELAWGYPQHFDQTVYLSESYYLYEKILAGEWAAVFAFLQNASTGILLQLERAVFFLFFGASRLSALTVNFIYLAAAQCAIFFLLKSLTKNIAISLMAFGLVLVPNTVFLTIGGLPDCRLDWVAYCLFLIFLGAVIKSNVFLTKRWSLVCASIAALLILHRFIYLVFIFAGIAIFFIVIVAFYCWRCLPKDVCGMRLRNMVLFSIATISLTLPFLALAWHHFFAYYYSNNLGPIRHAWAEIVGIKDWVGHLTFYPQMFFAYHMGNAVLLLGIFVILALLAMRKFVKPTGNFVYPYQEGALFLFFSLFAPLLILTINTAKNFCLTNIFVAAVLWLFILTVIYLARAIDGSSRFFNTLSAIALLIGFSCYAMKFGAHADTFVEKQDRQQVVKMYADIGRHCQQEEISRPLVSFFDNIVDYYVARLVNIVHYEQTGHLIEAERRSGIHAVTKDDLVRNLDASDVVVFNPESVCRPDSPYPFERTITQFRPLFEEKIKKMAKLGNYSFFGKHIEVYTRPRANFLITGISGGWLLPDTTRLRIPADVARRTSVAIISGEGVPSYVKGLSMSISADDFSQSRVGMTSVMLMDEARYAIYWAWDERQQDEDKPLSIHLQFDKYFIPKDLGINEDTRKLVLPAPQRKEALADLRQLVFPADRRYISGVYDDGFVGPDGIRFILAPGRNRQAKKLLVTVEALLPPSAFDNCMNMEILSGTQSLGERQLVQGINDLSFDVPESWRNSSLLYLYVKPKFHFVPAKISTSKDNRKLSFILKKISLPE